MFGTLLLFGTVGSAVAAGNYYPAQQSQWNRAGDIALSDRFNATGEYSCPQGTGAATGAQAFGVASPTGDHVNAAGRVSIGSSPDFAAPTAAVQVNSTVSVEPAPATASDVDDASASDVSANDASVSDTSVDDVPADDTTADDAAASDVSASVDVVSDDVNSPSAPGGLQRFASSNASSANATGISAFAASPVVNLASLASFSRSFTLASSALADPVGTGAANSADVASSAAVNPVINVIVVNSTANASSTSVTPVVNVLNGNGSHASGAANSSATTLRPVANFAGAPAPSTFLTFASPTAFESSATSTAAADISKSHSQNSGAWSHHGGAWWNNRWQNKWNKWSNSLKGAWGSRQQHNGDIASDQGW